MSGKNSCIHVKKIHPVRNKLPNNLLPQNLFFSRMTSRHGLWVGWMSMNAERTVRCEGIIHEPLIYTDYVKKRLGYSMDTMKNMCVRYEVRITSAEKYQAGRILRRSFWFPF